MAKGRLVGESLILPRNTQKLPNSGSAWRYIVAVVVMVLASIYAAPNLFQPDPALRIKPLGTETVVDDTVLASIRGTLSAADVGTLAVELEGASAVVRLKDKNDQQRARNLISDSLNAQRRAYVVALDQASTTPQWLKDMGAKSMSLGLDLSGGVHFLLQVDMEAFLGSRLKNAADAFRDILVDNRVRYAPGEWVQGRELHIPFASEEAREQGRQLINDANDGYQISEQDYDGKPGLRLRMSEQKIRELQDFAISQNLTSLRNRVNELGVAEPQVQRLGRERIVLDLPGLQDPARAKEIINKFANLEFRLVCLPSDRPSLCEEFVYEGRSVSLQLRNIVTGDDVINAIQDYDPETSQPQVSITLDADGGEKMHDVTKDHVNDDMSIIFIEQEPHERHVTDADGKERVEYYSTTKRRVINVANINSALGFRFRITGLEFQEARDLALLLRAGSLAAPMYIVEERTIGASLGDDNILRGQESLALGMMAVVLFMLFVYKAFGLIANLALTANVILIVAVMSILGATLTMPGIAGIVLTIGMAVDANVLIFSRIREELKERPPQQAIQAGFDRAFVTIFDANITTFFVAIILFSIGSGPVKGFAVTLAVGIATSMFTAVLLTQAMVNLAFGGRELKKVWI
ncbi:MAG: protein translocase subunit SecD [Pseudomonadales bacterium]|nr:protein translocase subunit SecD [Pseudomonadales bacterium]